MTFSATCNLLPGTAERLDATTTLTVVTKIGQAYRANTTRFPCTLDHLGVIPGISTITGLGRALIGLVHTIVHLACSIFSKEQVRHLKEAKFGAIHIGKGLIEAIPLVGNLAALIIIHISSSISFKPMDLENLQDGELILYSPGEGIVRGLQSGMPTEINNAINNRDLNAIKSIMQTSN